MLALLFSKEPDNIGIMLQSAEVLEAEAGVTCNTTALVSGGCDSPILHRC